MIEAQVSNEHFDLGDPKGIPKFVTQTKGRQNARRPTFGYMNVMVKGMEPIIFVLPEVISGDSHLVIECLQRTLKS